MNDDEDGPDREPGTFTHRVTPAASTTKPETNAPNSVFAMAAHAPAPAPAARVSLEERKQLALKQIDSCGELSMQQLAETLDVGMHITKKVMGGLLAEGAVREVRRHGRLRYYGLSKTRGLTRFLKGKATDGIAAGAELGRKAASAKPAQDASTSSSPPPKELQSASDWRAGFFSNGDLSIEVGGKSVCLGSTQARGFIAWLLKVDQAVRV